MRGPRSPKLCPSTKPSRGNRSGKASSTSLLEGHPTAARAYAWSSAIEGSDKRRVYAVLGIGYQDASGRGASGDRGGTQKSQGRGALNGSGFFYRLAGTALLLGVVTVAVLTVYYALNQPRYDGDPILIPRHMLSALLTGWWLFAAAGVSLVAAWVCHIWES